MRDLDSGLADVSVVRFADVRGKTNLFLDSVIPGYTRTVWMMIGPNDGWDNPEEAPALLAEDFTVGIIGCAPGCGAALHTHETVEVFMPLSGKWSIFTEQSSEGEIVIEPWDFVSVSPGVMRGFRNVGSEDAHLFAVTGGTDGGNLTWAQQVREEAHARNPTLDAGEKLTGGT
jgi:quercetin dioxygenase-like cupin family protein